MSRQLDVDREVRETAKRDLLVKVLEFGLVGALESQGIDLVGFAFKYDAYNCLMTIKGIIGGEQQVCFVGSDTLINCIIKSYQEARSNRLRWRPDRYAKSSA